jgi:hypothetical protein
MKEPRVTGVIAHGIKEGLLIKPANAAAKMIDN